MKIKFLSIIAILSISLNADIIISADNLPNISKEFLQHNFKAPIGIVQKDKNSYEVYLSDGTEVEFDIDGTWKEIENKTLPFNLDFLPQNLVNIIKNEFPNVKAREIERKINYYKIKLDNDVKILIDLNGTILHKEIDD
ncbi:TPA: PepSY-like domain-containing protein [Campylobacter jejuni]|nr:PepSY-like domain-containing protein [Campylobacter jejuni]HDZ5083259.1 PepSY-like domain-containing protein [Campylobacter jejuni]HDZ5084993.1 PepSY-like domain-containing protein [Campylobacter jejuni]HDZ5086746.1 PepSY-like domain-containing protein [Campylobacter jejuni]HDZ5089763.1 PepSY-like domain-containing protein [Campylobacter jejuni]